MMRIRGLKKGFGAGASRIEVLRGIDLEISAGTTALIGKSGSGKSTLLSLMAGLEAPDAGEVLIEGKDITRMGESELGRFRAAHMGIVFQQFHLVSTLTALENVALPLELLKRPQAREESAALLESVNLGHRLDHLPSQLSGGESQRVAIARALAPRPSLIFADEPSGNLDEETGEKVMNLLFSMVAERGATLVLVTHDPELAARCARVVHLEHGTLA
jgi:putative ABC transport system ATP-binding protein